MAQVMALVGVNAPEQHQHPVRPDAQREHLPAVALGAGRGEAGQFGHRHRRGGVSQAGRRRRPPRAEHDSHIVGVDSGAFGDRVGSPAGQGIRVGGL